MSEAQRLADDWRSDPTGDPDRIEPIVEHMLSLRARVAELEAAINTPRTDEFFAAVRNEAAHQIERWGVEHDAGKRAEDWLTLYHYLLGKAAKAHFENNRQKLLHHVITVAAVALNWHRNLTGEHTAMRPGVAHEGDQHR